MLMSLRQRQKSFDKLKMDIDQLKFQQQMQADIIQQQHQQQSKNIEQFATNGWSHSQLQFNEQSQLMNEESYLDLMGIDSKQIKASTQKKQIQDHRMIKSSQSPRKNAEIKIIQSPNKLLVTQQKENHNQQYDNLYLKADRKKSHNTSNQKSHSKGKVQFKTSLSPQKLNSQSPSKNIPISKMSKLSNKKQQEMVSSSPMPKSNNQSEQSKANNKIQENPYEKKHFGTPPSPVYNSSNNQFFSQVSQKNLKDQQQNFKTYEQKLIEKYDQQYNEEYLKYRQNNFTKQEAFIKQLEQNKNSLSQQPQPKNMLMQNHIEKKLTYDFSPVYNMRNQQLEQDYLKMKNSMNLKQMSQSSKSPTRQSTFENSQKYLKELRNLHLVQSPSKVTQTQYQSNGRFLQTSDDPKQNEHFQQILNKYQNVNKSSKDDRQIMVMSQQAENQQQNIRSIDKQQQQLQNIRSPHLYSHSNNNIENPSYNRHYSNNRTSK